MSSNTCLNENLKPDIVGGHNITNRRAIFDQDDKNIIVSSNRQLFYYNVRTGEESGRASITSAELTPCEKIVACERLDTSLFIFTNKGRTFTWSLNERDWMNEIVLPINEGETLISCKMLSKRQYIYSILDNSTNEITLNYSMSRSERERPKSRQTINKCSYGGQTSFDLGCSVTHESPDKKMSNTERRLVYIHGPYVYTQELTIGKKMATTFKKHRISLDFTCVKANHKRVMLAAGDTLGRIYLYTGDFEAEKVNRTKLHWHQLPVNDLCFSSTGNSLFSVGGESGCVVIWDLTQNNIGEKRVVAGLGVPIRHLNCGNILNQLILSFEDNELRFFDTSDQSRHLRTFSKRVFDMYKKNDPRALRSEDVDLKDYHQESVGLLWHSKTDTVVTNGRIGCLQFYNPKTKLREHSLNFLKATPLSLEKEAVVIPSDITKATLSLDGNWIAFYETRESSESFPEVKIHIWQRSSTSNRWNWIQTGDRMHSSASIADLKFSPDGQFLISVSEDGTFQILFRVSLTNTRQMYAKGFCGNVPPKLPAMTTFSQDSSVMAMSLKNETTLIWMIVSPYKLVYECQLNQTDSELESNDVESDVNNSRPFQDVLGLHFGYHKPIQSLAPLCEVRSNSIKIWNILNPNETMEYRTEGCPDKDNPIKITSAAFDQCPGDSRSLDHFAVCTNRNLILIFKLQINPATKDLTPLLIVDGTLPFYDSTSHITYTHMCFLSNPILEIDENCHSDPEMTKLLNRLCLMNSRQELVSITDKLTLERQLASNSCNAIKTFDMTKLQEYFTKKVSTYSEETKNKSQTPNTILSEYLTEKQKRIRKRLEVQKMLRDLLIRIPSQNLPKMEILGPMILDKLI